MGALAALLLLVPLVCGAQGDAPVARPEVKVGDRWIYRGPGDPYEVSVTFADGKVIHTVVTWKGGAQESDQVWTSEWNNIVSAPGSAAQGFGMFDPHSGLFKFPLRVGSTWKSAYELRRPRMSEFRLRHEGTVTVVAYEDIVVTAGRFRALKMVAEGSYRRFDTAASGTTRTEVWYVPEVKRWVKIVHEDFTGARTVVRREDELLFFRVQ